MEKERARAKDRTKGDQNEAKQERQSDAKI